MAAPGTGQEDQPVAYHGLEPRIVAARLGVDTSVGLSTADVTRRSALYGPNALDSAQRVGVWRMLIDALTEPFVLLLLGAGTLAIAVGEVRDGLLVLAGLLPIVGADVLTEYRGERALEALRDASAPVARVRRDGQQSVVGADSLVPGDLVMLQTGDVVPADLRIAHAQRLLLDRSTLTGESIPEEGRAAPDPPASDMTARRSVAYAGTSVVGGRGEGIVFAIGAATEFGRVARLLASQERHRSPLQRELDRLVRILLVAAVLLIAFTVGAGFSRGHPVGENVLAGISAAIAAVPEEPPVLLAVVLGLGAYRLLRRGVLVRRLNAEETLGAVDLIITDKTGTITQNKLLVSSIRTPAGPVTDPFERRALLEEALRAEEDAWQGEGAVAGSFTRALRTAIVDAGGQAELPIADLIDAIPPGDGVPISRARVRHNGDVESLVLGAPEVVVAYTVASDEGASILDAWLRLIHESATAGERIVALASRVNDEPWRMRALIGFADPVRPDVAEALSIARRAGIKVIVVTGDHRQTAATIARVSGLAAERIVTGEEIAGWDAERLAIELPTLDIVARCTPEQKRRLVDAARRDGRIVAVTGDGVNDAPALHRASVAVAMGSGTAVAREASDLVLGDNSFATLMHGLAEGRRIVDNVQKGLVFVVSTHVAFLGFILVSTIAVAQQQVLIPLQILWMEFFIDLSTSVAFERERPEPSLMTRPPRHAERPLLTRRILAGVGIAGAFTAAGAMVLLLGRGGGFEHAAWLAYTTLVVGQCVRAYWNRSIREPIHRLSVNPFLLIACVAAVGVQAAIPYVPPLADAFRATPLDAMEWLLVAAIAVAPAGLAELVRTLRRGSTEWVA